MGGVDLLNYLVLNYSVLNPENITLYSAMETHLRKLDEPPSGQEWYGEG